MIAVVALGLLGAGITEPNARGTAFSSLGAVVPIVYMTTPVIVGAVFAAAAAFVFYGARRRLARYSQARSPAAVA